ncbi:putative holliday junction resolvase [Lachnospiraceae bacterium C10]|jgi:putative Holliday junction resolvase|nr:Holliday junction resolvase RuvX [Lachnospiraceae bacterium]SCW32539.1 putative holliday junction resolvase [Lachnospiraceae bacterium C10]
MTENNRILGLDYGSKTVGVAISDPLLLTAQGLEIIRREKPTKLRRTIARIGQIIDEYHVNRIVVGLPKNMDGTEGERCELSRAFAKMLEEKFDLDVEMYDERLTTVAADNAMKEVGIDHHTERKKYVDEIAAMLILQGYMDRRSNEVNNG